jgi:ATP-binding cassette, subfamily B, bacterial
VRGRIEFQDVHFSYDGQHAALRDLSLCVEPGQITVLVGPTGSGKSTLVKLLLRLHSQQRGRILFDGQDISQLAVHDLRRTIGVVSQEVFLFHGTIRSNIALGMADAKAADIERAAELAGVQEFVGLLPHGYDTLVGDRGYLLSGGQRQRIALARALLHTPPVLILDEATSQVDNKTEADIYASLMRAAQGRTVLAIAHRLSVARYASRICVLERGHVSEQGTHEDLVQRNGLYAALWRLQAGEADAQQAPPPGQA